MNIYGLNDFTAYSNLSHPSEDLEFLYAAAAAPPDSNNDAALAAEPEPFKITATFEPSTRHPAAIALQCIIYISKYIAINKSNPDIISTARMLSPQNCPPEDRSSAILWLMTWHNVFSDDRLEQIYTIFTLR